MKYDQYVSKTHSIIDDESKVHIAWIRGQNSSNTPEVILYSCFDPGKNSWAEPVQLFSEPSRKEKIKQSLDALSLARCDDAIYCVWSLAVFDRTNWPASLSAESGIFICSKTDSGWNQPLKLVDSPASSCKDPQIIVDKNNTLYVFWIEEDKGLFYKYRLGSNWSSIYEAVKDARISIEIESIGSFQSACPYDISVDQDNNFHVAYVRRNPMGALSRTESSELIYVKLVRNECIVK